MRTKLWNKYKEARENKKGFTLVELIVVLVIIGILAAILVPSVLKYIDDAKTKQILADAKNVYTAAQSAASEVYGQVQPKLTDITNVKIGKFLDDATINKNTNVTWFATFDKEYKVEKILYKDSAAGLYASLDTATSKWDTGKITTTTPEDLTAPAGGALVSKS